jgi:hypothetical protein
MAYSVSNNSYIGRGKLNVRLRGVGSWRWLGNSSAANLAISSETITEPDFSTIGGGNLNESSRVSAVGVTISTYDHRPENLGILLRGLLSEVPREAITGEVHTVYPGGFEPFENIHDPDVAPVLVRSTTAEWAATTVVAQGYAILDGGRIYVATTGGTTGGTEPTWPTNGGTVADGTAVWQDTGTTALVAGTDYDLTASGFQVADDGKLRWSVLGEPITAAYTSHEAVEIHSLTQAGVEWEVFLEGLNKSDSGNPATIHFPRVTFSPTAGLDLIGEREYQQAEIVATVLRDPAVTSLTESAFFTVKMVRQAAV